MFLDSFLMLFEEKTSMNKDPAKRIKFFELYENMYNSKFQSMQKH